MAFDLAKVKQHLGTRQPPETPPGEARAAVAAILREGLEGAELLFIKRAEREGDPWSGHLAFPGGKREPTDESLAHTSRREVEEEVGLKLPAAACLTRLQDVVARVNGYRVAQFVFALDDSTATLTTNAEVAATIWVPLARLARFEGAGMTTFVQEGRAIDLPCFRLGAYVLWGMTYRMVLQLLEALGASTSIPTEQTKGT